MATPSTTSSPSSTSSPPPAPQLSISILVYKGTPLDLQSTRPVQLWVRTTGSPGSPTTPPFIIHLSGSPLSYTFQTRDSTHPYAAPDFVKQILVGRTSKGLTKEGLVGICKEVGVDNSSTGFNGQTWLGDCLVRLVGGGYLERDRVEKAVTDMVVSTMEAEDEE